MPRRRKSVAPQTPEAVLLEQINDLQKAVAILRGARMSTAIVCDVENFNDPAEGMTAIDWPTGKYCWYHDGAWICTPDSLSHAIKVFSDRTANKIGDGAFKFNIDPKLDDTELIFAGAFNGTAGAGSTIVQISNRTRGLDMLSTRITIASGVTSNYSSSVINTGGVTGNPNNRVHLHDDIWIDVDAIGAGSKGLGVYLYFDKPRIPAVDV